MAQLGSLFMKSWDVGAGFGLLDPVTRMAGHLTNGIVPNVPPDPDAMARAFRSGLLRQEVFYRVANWCGVNVPVWDGQQFSPQSEFPSLTSFGEAWSGVWNSQEVFPQPEELMQMWRQKIISDDTWTKYMQRIGIWSADNRIVRWKLFNRVIPPPDALVSFALREAWDAATVNRFQYDDEFPPEFRAWMAAQGADGAAPPGGPGPAAAGDPTWSQLYWRVHWTAISPNLAYEMFQRLRPGRVDRYAADLPGLRAFTFQDLQQVLKINDYPVPFRPQLAAISYRRPRLVDIDRFFQAGAIGVEEVFELHRDLGYSPLDARTRTDWLTTKSLGAKLPPARKNPIPSILRIYRIGLSTRINTLNLLVSALSDGEWSSAAIVPEDVNQARRFTQYVRAANQLLQSEDLRIASAKAQEILTATKRQFLHGVVNETNALAQLTAAAFTSERARDYLDSWKRILQSGRLLLSTSKIRELVTDGILPIETATLYLKNLGWKDPEIELLVRQFTLDAEAEQERLQERAARTERQKREAQERQAAALERARRQVVQRLNRQATPAALHRYAVRGIISLDEYQQELGRRGFELTEVDRRRRQAEQERAEYLARKRKRQAAAGTAAAGTATVP